MMLAAIAIPGAAVEHALRSADCSWRVAPALRPGASADTDALLDALDRLFEEGK